MFVPFDLPEPPKPPTPEEMKAMEQNPRAFAGRYTFGMTLRDYFAGQALQGLIAEGLPNNDWPDDTYIKIAARASYDFADAMLAERAKQGDR